MVNLVSMLVYENVVRMLVYEIVVRMLVYKNVRSCWFMSPLMLVYENVRSATTSNLRASSAW